MQIEKLKLILKIWSLLQFVALRNEGEKQNTQVPRW